MSPSTLEEHNAGLQLRLLGDLQVLRDGATRSLPASKKTRALLAYLVVTRRRQLRAHLCDLLWEGTDDPRAALRWSLTKLRPLLCDRDMLVADREGVELGGDRVATDLERVRALTGEDVAAASREALAEAAGLFRGELLNGLELPGCYRYYEWCLGQRQAAGRLHEAILAELVERLGDAPGEALGHARALVARDPLNERGHIEVMRLLGTLGRRREALAQYEQCARIFERELGRAPSAALDIARRNLRPPGRQAVAAREKAGSEAPARASAGSAPAAFVGRGGETALFDRIIEDARARRRADVLLITGSPGFGKSRLLDELARKLVVAHGTALVGRTFEAEMVRPFGAWIDALRGLDDAALPAASLEALAPLLDARSDRPAPSDRNRLFDAVVAGLSHLAASGPLGVLVDDLQWLDESSTALLHYTLRRLEDTGIVCALSARPGELEDNAPAQALIGALEQTSRLRRIKLEPLPEDEALSLVTSLAPEIDPREVVARAEGNPLYLIELARAPSPSPQARHRLDETLDTRLAVLAPAANELLQWASAFGRGFPPDVLIDACGLDPGQANSALAELERHDFIRAGDSTRYDFAHDLIRQAAYRRVSQPRRRLIHSRISALLGAHMAAAPETADDVAYHAALGEQHELAGRAAVTAGEHGLRIFANSEAAELARRGLAHIERIDDSTLRARLRMALLRIAVLAASGPVLRKLPPLAEPIERAIEEAGTLGLHAEVAQGWHLISVLQHEAGDFPAAEEATLEAAHASRTADTVTQARQLAGTGRCLVELGREIERARGLIGQARALIERTGVEETEVSWGSGLLHNWDGELDEAIVDLEHALALARRSEDRWRECRCLGWLAMVELERHRARQALARARELEEAAHKLGEGAGAPLAHAIGVLARQMMGDGQVDPGEAIAVLRRADDKSNLAYALNIAAEAQFAAGAAETAYGFASDALAVAETIADTNQAALARALVIASASARGEVEVAAQEIEISRKALETRGQLSAKTRRAVSRAVECARA